MATFAFMDIVAFAPDQNLIDHKFSGYKLSLEPILIYEKDLGSSIKPDLPSNDQYARGFVKIFLLHNYLHLNPNTPELCYFIKDHEQIMQLSVGFMNRIDKIINVCAIPKNRDRCPGDFPPDIKFLSVDRAVIADGTGIFHIAAVKKDKWVIIFTDNLPENSVLLSAFQSEKNVQILTRNIIEPKFDSILTLITLDENWQVLNNRKVQVAGNVIFASIESLKYLSIITDGETAKFLDGSENAHLEKESKFKWTQTADDVSLLFNVRGIDKDHVTITTNDQNIIVSLNGRIEVQGDFTHRVSDVFCSILDGELEIKAKKVEKDVGWVNAIEGETCGQQIQISTGVVENEDHVLNIEELEDVDISSPQLLMRLDMQNSRITHQASLTSTPFLHTVTIDPSKPAAICLKYFTDACVWQCQTNENGSWDKTHVGTFSALGYVQASKTQRKFIVAAPNLSYVIIADACRHLYIFRQPSPVNGTLRNRTSGATIAKQQLVNLETNEEILGIQATNTLAFVLTSKKMHTLVINELTL